MKLKRRTALKKMKKRRIGEGKGRCRDSRDDPQSLMTSVSEGDLQRDRTS
jgi:hypothetical protein